MNPRIDQIIVYVSDMDRSLGFYRDNLGFRAIVESPDWSELDAGTFRLALHSASGLGSDEDRMTAGRTDLQIGVENLDVAYHTLREAGWDVPEPFLLTDINLRVLQMHDPDGLAITLSASSV